MKPFLMLEVERVSKGGRCEILCGLGRFFAHHPIRKSGAYLSSIKVSLYSTNGLVSCARKRWISCCTVYIFGTASVYVLIFGCGQNIEHSCWPAFAARDVARSILAPSRASGGWRANDGPAGSAAQACASKRGERVQSYVVYLP